MTATPNPSTGCRLVAVDGRALPLRRTDLLAEAGGGLARVRLRQTFENPHADPLAVTYLLPLPADGAVVDFAFVLAGRRVAGRVERRADARAAFEQAVLEGRTAALLEQDRADVFTQELGNIPPGAEVEVEIEVEQLLAWVDNGWEWRWPTVVGPRYLGDRTEDAERVTVDVAEQVPVLCTTTVRTDDATGAVTSPSHPIDDGQLVGLLDRDVVVRWPAAPPQPGVRLEVTRDDEDAYGLLTIVPPQVAGPPVARDVCLLLDTSGSMSGAPLDHLRAFARGVIAGLADGDRLEMIAFSTRPQRWQEAPVRVDGAARAAALRWVAALRAGGGTAMHDAIAEALRPLRDDAERQVVLVTDGYIGFERDVIGRIRSRLPRGARVHAVGIGSSVNRTLTRGVARAGGGVEAIVSDRVDEAVARLLAHTGDPLWVDVIVEGTAVREVAPATIGDLLAKAPSRVAVRLDPAGGTLVVRARTADGPVVRELAVAPVAAGSGRRVVATRFAREAVDDLEVALAGGEDAARIDAAIEALGLRHRIATRRTSWVAVGEVGVDPSAPTRRERMPHLLPHGVSAEGVGLRRARPLLAEAASDAIFAMRAPAPAGPPPPRRKAAFAAPPPPRPVLRARIVARLPGRLVLEVTVDRRVAWSVDRPVVVTAGGRAPARTERGTTTAPTLEAGQVARLVLRWDGADPVRIELGDLVLEVG